MTFAVQCFSSWISKLSTPGMSFAISDGSLMTLQTVSREADELLRPRDDHFDVTETFARVASGSWSIDHTLCAGLQLS